MEKIGLRIEDFEYVVFVNKIKIIMFVNISQEVVVVWKWKFENYHNSLILLSKASLSLSFFITGTRTSRKIIWDIVGSLFQNIIWGEKELFVSSYRLYKSNGVTALWLLGERDAILSYSTSHHTVHCTTLFPPAGYAERAYEIQYEGHLYATLFCTHHHNKQWILLLHRTLLFFPRWP